MPGSPAVAEGDYVSAMFRDFREIVSRPSPPAPVLDLGPSVPGNLMFWIRRGHPIGAVDIGSRGSEGLAELRQGPGSVAGVLCWTALSYLAPEEVPEVLEGLAPLLRPGGALFAIFDGDGNDRPERFRYRILGPDRLGFERRSGPRPRAVPTREIEQTLGEFGRSRLMVMRHGSREVVCRFGQPARPTLGRSPSRDR